MQRKLIVTHHAPDLDAIGAVWMLKRFDSQHYADAKVSFVNPGDSITLAELAPFECTLDDVTHVDTGMGEFDHHQPERGLQHTSASLLVYEYVSRIHPDLAHDQALRTVADFITDIDHFGEIYWPEASAHRHHFMIHDLIHGIEFTTPHDDTSQLHFGMQCLDAAYATITQVVKAEEIIEEEGRRFTLPIGRCLALETKNDDTIKVAQKQGYMLVVRKDPEQGNIRVKARPDAAIDLKTLADAISKIDGRASWFYHPSGKMLINGSRKHRNQKASELELQQVVDLLVKLYG